MLRKAGSSGTPIATDTKPSLQLPVEKNDGKRSTSPVLIGLIYKVDYLISYMLFIISLVRRVSLRNNSVQFIPANSLDLRL